MARRGKEKFKVVETREDLSKWMTRSEKVLLVIDFHLTWCGRCVVMDPLYNRISLEMDEWEKRVAFLAVDRSLLTEEDKETFPVPDGCKPFFAVVKHGIVIGKVEGANSAELLAIIEDNIFPAPDK